MSCHEEMETEPPEDFHPPLSTVLRLLVIGDDLLKGLAVARGDWQLLTQMRLAGPLTSTDEKIL